MCVYIYIYMRVVSCELWLVNNISSGIDLCNMKGDDAFQIEVML